MATPASGVKGKPAAENKLAGLALSLVQAGLLDEVKGRTHFEDAEKKKIPFVTYLVTHNILKSREIALIAQAEFGVPLLDVKAIDRESMPLDRVSEALIRKHHAIPLFLRGNQIFIALSDPTNVAALDEIKFHTKLSAHTILVEEEKLTDLIEKAMEDAAGAMDAMLDDDLGDIDIDLDEPGKKDDVDSEVDEAPIVKFVNKLLLDSIKKGVSDIHLEPYEKVFRIRTRHDGMLHEVVSPPASLANRIISRIKVMSRMDIAERRVPQDGRIKMHLSKNRAIDFRVNTCPTLYGEKVVLRILDPTSAQLGVEKLGFEPQQMDDFMKAIKKPYGMILVTGPTGSGKTVSLYTALNILNTVDVNISTAEDPVEITVQGINQVNVNPKAGLEFSDALKAFLRQDPDIIMVGEIRDKETADIAVKAAQTGHLVLSTLHTNDAPQTLNRLYQMGVLPFNVASSVLLIMAQRLARRLCPDCKEEKKYPRELLIKAGFKEDEVDDLTLYGPVGCDKCVEGYKGRVGIYQVMPVSAAMKDMILETANAMELARQAEKEGVNDLRVSGLMKVSAGVTSLEEVDRVTTE